MAQDMSTIICEAITKSLLIRKNPLGQFLSVNFGSQMINQGSFVKLFSEQFDFS